MLCCVNVKDCYCYQIQLGLKSLYSMTPSIKLNRVPGFEGWSFIKTFWTVFNSFWSFSICASEQNPKLFSALEISCWTFLAFVREFCIASIWFVIWTLAVGIRNLPEDFISAICSSSFFISDSATEELWIANLCLCNSQSSCPISFCDKKSSPDFSWIMLSLNCLAVSSFASKSSFPFFTLSYFFSRKAADSRRGSSEEFWFC